MTNERRRSWAWVALLGLGACAGAPSKGADAPEAKGAPTKSEPAKSEPAKDDPRDAAKPPPPKMPVAQSMGGGKEATGMNETTEISGGQCDDLEKILVGLIHRDLFGKIDPKLEAARKQKAESDAEAEAKKTAAQFGDNCRSNMAGKSVKREVLQCMFKAKDFASFEACNR